MKYRVQCEKCRADYVVDVDFVPGFCAQCGNDHAVVTPFKTKSRVTAESKMQELDNLRPRLDAAWNEYFAMRVEYEDALQFLAQYHKRGIVSADEYNSRKLKYQSVKKELNEALKEFRAKRQETSKGGNQK